MRERRASRQSRSCALTLRKRKDSKYINPADQVRARKADRVRLVKMQPTVELPDPEPAAVPGDKS